MYDTPKGCNLGVSVNSVKSGGQLVHEGQMGRHPFVETGSGPVSMGLRACSFNSVPSPKRNYERSLDKSRDHIIYI